MPRTAAKKTPVVITPSKEAIVAEMATGIWGQLFTPNTEDAEKNAAAYKSATDQLQKLMEALRQRRDASKPVIRERLETSDVLTQALGKPMTDLQAAYVQLPIGEAKNGSILYDRINLPKLRTYAETEGHPLHQAALDFMKAEKLRFVNRPGKTKGKEITVLESTKRAANATA